MTHNETQKFASDWASAWNTSDVEKVLAHFTDDIVFVSPSALDFTGNATVRGKAALRAYWTSALQRVGSLHFTVDRVLWDAASSELAIIYTSKMAGKTKRMSENLRFDANGKIASAEVFHGITPPA